VGDSVKIEVSGTEVIGLIKEWCRAEGYSK
jgi:hypothetical protein